MKTNAALIALLIVLTSCDILIVEPAIDYRERITGSYEVEEHSQTYSDFTNYDIYIRKSGFNDEVIIENFYGAGLDVRATVDCDKIYIGRQVVDGYKVEGVGTLYGNEIRFSYSVTDTWSSHSTTDFCNATAWLY
jgi:hypothetical protein